jgi:hypothetical protein
MIVTKVYKIVRRLASRVYWNVLIVRRARCFVLGHNIVVERWTYEPAYCKHCMQEHDKIDEQMTMPQYLNNLYCWLVDHGGNWFETFDLWMIKTFGNRLPKWWEY